MSTEEYVVVTTIQTFRHRYAIPMSKLQELNPAKPVDSKWALDSVTCNEVREFSQLHLGETISDHVVLREEEMLALFDQDNDYLKAWSKEQKLKYVNNCWEDEPQELYHNFLASEDKAAQ